MSFLSQRVSDLNASSHEKGQRVQQQLKKDEIVHDFRASLRRGKAVEKEVQALYEELGFKVATATRAEQLDGVDLHVRVRTDMTPGSWRKLEVKFDERSAETGNIFIELYSDEDAGKKGWALTTTANMVLVVCPSENGTQMYFLRPKELRVVLGRWKAMYQSHRAYNATYNSLGVCVPLRELDALAHVSLNGRDLNDLSDEEQQKLLGYCLA